MREFLLDIEFSARECMAMALVIPTTVLKQIRQRP